MTDVPPHNIRKKAAPESSLELQILSRSSKRRKTTPSRDNTSGTLPLDIWLLVADFISDNKTLSRLSRVSKELYQILSPRLYRDLVAAASSHVNIRGFIEKLERYLSISQQKLLASEKSYPGQTKARALADVPDENFVPYCTRFVRRVLVDWSNPGQAHVEALARYIEEVLQNTSELEAFVWNDSHIPYTSTIGDHVGRLRGLKAFTFNLCAKHELASLQGIRDLIYLDLYSHQSYCNPEHTKQLLLGSHKTLEALIYEQAISPAENPIYLGQLLQHDGRSITFPKLTALVTKPCQILSNDAKAFVIGINFPQLTYFEFSTSEYQPGKFSHEELFSKLVHRYNSDPHEQRLGLKTFRFRSAVPVYPDEDFLALLSSFNSLRTFIFEETSHSNEDQAREEEDGCVEALMKALSGHQDLEWLGINVPSGNGKRWLVSPHQISLIRDRHPYLKHLSCLCDKEQKDDFFALLPTFPNLACFHLPAARWVTMSPVTIVSDISKSICHPFLRQYHDGASVTGTPTWKARYKLRLLVLGYSAYHIASEFPPDKPRSRYPKSAIQTTEPTLFYKPVAPDELHESDCSNVGFLKATEWRNRNYDYRGDWFQNIKLS
ncbi:hypothetical protein AA313_de0206678 [Arthrobotrys entomopaga]|nr:hypothetical protein AA313_de0206678 [Arthrobotrys entomopaga]